MESKGAHPLIIIVGFSAQPTIFNTTPHPNPLPQGTREKYFVYKTSHPSFGHPLSKVEGNYICIAPPRGEGKLFVFSILLC